MKNKTVIVTGASDGLGKAAATKLVAQGAKVVLVALEEDKLRQLTHELGGQASFYLCDISNVDEIHATVQKILADHPRIDVLINNAGIWTDEDIEQTDAARRKKVLEVNTLGTIEFTKALETHLVKQNSGHIVNVISTAGTNDTSSGDNTRWHTYGASKWALAGFTRALKDTLENNNIKVTGFYPGGFDSNLYESAGKAEPHNQPWMMTTEDVADALLFCLTRPADMVVEKLVVTKFGNN